LDLPLWDRVPREKKATARGDRSGLTATLDKAWREIEFGRTNHGRVLTDEEEKDWERQKRHRKTAVSR